MKAEDYLKILVEDIHSTVIAAIDLTLKPAVIDQNHCLHCDRCVPVCPVNAIIRF
jgi:ferredoxin